MKVKTLTTVRTGKPGEFKHLAPGVHDLDKELAEDLIRRGAAVTEAAAQKAAAEETKKAKGAVKVTAETKAEA